MNKPRVLTENEFLCNLNGKNIIFNNEVILKRMEAKENENIVNIPVILYNNNLRIASIVKSEKEQEDIDFKEIIEEEEKYIPQYLFDFSLISHLKKLKINSQENKKLVISIFNQNREDLTQFANNKEKVKNVKDLKSLKYLKKIGFIPNNIIGDYKVEYKLYDLCEQDLIYHLFLTKFQKLQVNKTILLLNFDKLVLNYAIYNEGIIDTKLKDIDNNECKNTEDFIFDFIKKANDSYEGVALVLCCIDYKEEEKKNKLDELFEKIKKYCTEELEPKVPLVLYKDNSFNAKVFRFINLFYEN